MKSYENIKNEILLELQSKRAVYSSLIQKKREVLLEKEDYVTLVKKQNDLFKKIFFSDDNNTPPLKKELQNLDTEIEKTEKKYNHLFINPTHDCEICNDNGFYTGKLCACVNKKIQKRLLSNLTYSLYDANEIFKGLKQEKAMHDLYNTFIKFTNNYPHLQQKNILLSGVSGIGKTCAFLALLNSLIAKDINILFISAFELNNIFLKYRTAPMEQKNDIIEPILTTEFLAIDDLGSEPIFKNVTLETLLMVICLRQDSNLGTAINTNLPIISLNDGSKTLLDVYGERIFSRIANKNITYIKQILNATNIRTL